MDGFVSTTHGKHKLITYTHKTVSVNTVPNFSFLVLTTNKFPFSPLGD